jgi:hypothetical protein
VSSNVGNKRGGTDIVMVDLLGKTSVNCSHIVVHAVYIGQVRNA